MINPLNNSTLPATRPINLFDRPQHYDHVRAAQSEAEMGQVLVSLPMPALTALLSDATRKKQTPWLRSAMAIGTFDFSLDVARDLSEFQSLTALDAVLDFLRDRHLDPVLSDAADPANNFIGALEGNGIEEFKAFFSDLVDHLLLIRPQAIKINLDRLILAESAEKFGGMSKSRSPDNNAAIDAAFGRLLLGACVLDLPHAVRSITAKIPAAARSKHDIEALLGHMQGTYTTELFQENKQEFYFSPAFFALQMSRTACLNAMQEAAGQTLLPMGWRETNKVLDRDPQASQSAASLAQAAFSPRFRKIVTTDLDVIDLFSLLTPVCQPHTLATALQARLLDTRPTELGGPDRPGLHAVALKAAGPYGWEKNLQSCVPGLITGGAFDIDATASMAFAIEEGLPVIAESLHPPIAWEKIFTNPTSDCEDTPVRRCLVNAILPQSNKHFDIALSIAIDKAVHKGYHELVISSVPERNSNMDDSLTEKLGPVLAQPISSIIREGFTASLLALLHAGLQTQKPLHPGTLSVKEMAEIVSPEMAHLVHSFEARKLSLALLHGLDEGTPTPPKVSFFPL